MSIEGQLQQAFREHAGTISPPPAVDAAVAAMYRRQAMGSKGVNHRMKTWKMSRVAIVALVVVVLSGFAYAGSKLLFQQETGHVGISYRAVEGFKIPDESLDRIRIELNEVKAQLDPGEQAVVYLEDLEIVKPYGLDPILGVAKPETVRTLEAWQAEIAAETGITPPGELLSGEYAFAEGFAGYPFGESLGQSALELVPELEAELDATGKTAVWREIDTNDAPVNGYTTSYRAGEDAIHYTVEAVTEKIKIEMMTNGGTEFERVEVNGGEAAYTYSEISFFSSQYREITWMEEHEGRTLIHRIGSDSANVTKEELLEAANRL